MRYHPETDIYDALGCDPSASAEEIAAALRQRRHVLADYAALLQDPEKRREYDRQRTEYLRSREAHRTKATAGAKGSVDLGWIALAALGLGLLLAVLMAR